MLNHACFRYVLSVYIYIYLLTHTVYMIHMLIGTCDCGLQIC